MRRLAYLVAALALSSCTTVDDFGAYWDRAGIDDALEGTWQKAESGQNASGAPAPAVWTFTKSGSSYMGRAMSPLGAGRVDSRPFEARSLRVGMSTFLMLRDPRGQGRGWIERYDVQGTTLRAYRIEGKDVAIKTFDEAAFSLLSDLASDPSYWRLDAEYTRFGIAGDASGLAAPPGSSLPPSNAPRRQVVTLFEMTQQRDAGSQFFIAGSGYVEINGGGTFFAGMNRALDPFIELTIADRTDPVLAACRDLLVPETFTSHAVQIGGLGSFSGRPGVQDRRLAVVRLEKLTLCKLVDRR